MLRVGRMGKTEKGCVSARLAGCNWRRRSPPPRSPSQHPLSGLQASASPQWASLRGTERSRVATVRSATKKATEEASESTGGEWRQHCALGRPPSWAPSPGACAGAALVAPHLL